MKVIRSSASFYPSIMVEYKVAPKHLDMNAFTGVVKYFRDTRVQAKHSKEKLIDGVPPKILAEALKIAINSLYGKFGFEYGDLYDRLCTLIVTINGQLMIMMLCEELELNGIEVVSANTDGIVVKLYKKDKKKFDEIAGSWMRKTKLSADSEEYLVYCCRDINNYAIKEVSGKVTTKGDFNETMYLKSLDKGYDMPVIAKAVVEYFLNGTPVTQTLCAEGNILNFCKSQNIGRSFHAEITKGTERQRLQRYVRFYVSNSGYTLEKVKESTGQRSNLCSGQYVTVLNSLDDMDLSFRDINYSYYYREAMKIIDPIRLGISTNSKGDMSKGTRSGKVLLRKYSGDYQMLFDDNDDQ